MFSGIVEAVEIVSHVEKRPNSLWIKVKKPNTFNDINDGDSISVNGVCLTVETIDRSEISFTLAAETLHVLRIQPESLLGKKLNLERSLRFGDRIHGHLVTGHVEALGTVVRSEGAEDSWFLDVKVPLEMQPYLWKKGSITLHGVSLTVNECKDGVVSVCLIPETMKRTNLGALQVGDAVNLEPDYFAKVVVQQWLQNKQVKEVKVEL